MKCLAIIQCFWLGFMFLASTVVMAEMGVLMLRKPWPRKLSQWNIFLNDGHRLRLNQDVHAYKLKNALFSDYATKFRTFYLPPQTQIHTLVSGRLQFPAGSIISKTFAYSWDEIIALDSKNGLSSNNQLEFDEKMSDLHGSFLLETRLLIKTSHGTWIGLPYVWLPDQSDALLEIVGKKIPITITKSNQEIQLNYQIPNINQCKSCHLEIKGFTKKVKPIGFHSKHLNHLVTEDRLTLNQLAYWVSQGWLDQKIDDKQPSMPHWNDETQPTALRARAYLDINCAHCHSPHGAGHSSGLFLNFEETRPVRLGICKSPVAPGNGSAGLPYSIYPGNPEKSLLIQRFRSTNPETMMPELGRSSVHGEAVRLLEAWVLGLDKICQTNLYFSPL